MTSLRVALCLFEYSPLETGCKKESCAREGNPGKPADLLSFSEYQCQPEVHHLGIAGIDIAYMMLMNYLRLGIYKSRFHIADAVGW